MTDDLIFKPLQALAESLQKRIVSPVEVVDIFFDRINKVNRSFPAYITVARDFARHRAKQVEHAILKGNFSGVLQGIPYACKDLFATKNIRTTGGSKVLNDWIPDYDADAVSILSAAGGILLGKLNQHEFAYGATGKNEHFGTVPNPHDPNRLAGGSSSGSAAAVAAGLASYALGTDTGGSTRSPAALCGVVGLKPTYDLISTKGIIPYCWSLDHVGILARTVSDAVFVFQTLACSTGKNGICSKKDNLSIIQASSIDFGKLRIGVPKHFFFDTIDEEIDHTVKKAITVLEDQGVDLVDIEIPSVDEARTVSLAIQLPEMLSYHSQYLPGKKNLYGKDIRAGMAQGQFILAEHYLRAKRMVHWYRKKVKKIFETVDLIITPSCPIVAPDIDVDFIDWGNKKEPVGNAITRYTSIFNMTGNPAISIPCGVHSSQLPIGIQLIGPYFREKMLLNVASVLEMCLAKKHHLS